MTASLSDLHDSARQVDRPTWNRAWIAHADGQATVFPLPPMPPAEIQRITNNMSGGATMAHGADHYNRWLRTESTRERLTRVIDSTPERVHERLDAGEVVFGSTKRWPGYGITRLPYGWPARRWPEIGVEVTATRTDYYQHVQLARPR